MIESGTMEDCQARFHVQGAFVRPTHIRLCVSAVGSTFSSHFFEFLMCFSCSSNERTAQSQMPIVLCTLVSKHLGDFWQHPEYNRRHPKSRGTKSDSRSETAIRLFRIAPNVSTGNAVI
jgi:hypothetical protein